MKGQRKIDEYIITSILECPKAAEDDTLLVSLVYERYLGETRAELYGLKWCMENFALAKLPAPASVRLRKLQLIASGKIKTEGAKE